MKSRRQLRLLHEFLSAIVVMAVAVAVSVIAAALAIVAV